MRPKATNSSLTVVGHLTKCSYWIRRIPHVRVTPVSPHICMTQRYPPALVNVFKIKHGKETHVYRADSASDKKNILSQFRHVAEELAAKKRKEREGEHERRKSLWAAGGVRCLGSCLPSVDSDFRHFTAWFSRDGRRPPRSRLDVRSRAASGHERQRERERGTGFPMDWRFRR
jgi:hypothetical protein